MRQEQEREFQVEVADGRTIPVMAPSEAAAAKAAAQWARDNPPDTSAEDRGRDFANQASLFLQRPNPATGVAGPAVGAFTRQLELQDELVGLGARAYGGITGQEIDPRTAAEQSRLNIAQYREERPISSLAEEMIAGGFIPARAGRELAEGAVIGGITGAASGTSATDRTGFGVLGGAIGGAFGGVAKSMNPLVARLGAAARRLGLSRRGSAAGRAAFTPEEADAFEALAEAFRADGRGPDDVMAFAQAAAGDDKAALMDFVRPGGAVEELLNLAGRQTSAANVQLTDRLLNLTENATRNVQDAIRSNIGVGRVRPTIEALEEARRVASDPLYEAFRNQRPIIAARLNEEGFGNAPAFVRAFEDAAVSILNDMPADPAARERARQTSEALNNALIRGTQRGRPTLRINPDAQLTPEMLDQVKRNLDEQIRVARGGANPNLDEARRLQNLRNEFVKTLDRIYPDTYAAARAAYAGPTAVINAAEAGRDLFKTDIEELGELVANMGDSEYEAFRIGASRALTDRISRVGEDSAAAPGRLLTGDAQDRVRLLFRGEEENADAFIEQLRRQRDRIRAARRSTPGRGGADEEIRTPQEIASSAVFEGLNFQPGSVLRTIINETRAGLEAESTRARNEAIARIASSINQLDRNAQEVVFRQLNQEFGEEVARRVRGAVNRVVRGIGTQVSQREDPLTSARVRNMRLSGL